MKRPFRLIKLKVFFLLWLVGVPFGGCAWFEESRKVEPVLPHEKEWASKYEVLAKESRAEADRLRSELATMRIAAAKNNGVFKLTQASGNTPSLKETELAEKVEALKADNLKLQEERDQLQNQNVQLQARSEALPGMRQLVMDIKALQTSVHQLVTKMESLSSDIVQVKQDIALQEQALEVIPHQVTARPAPKASVSVTKRPPAPEPNPEPLRTSESSADELEPEMQIITVEWGDTLWDIARTHDISVEELKEINGMTSDSIYEGQRLEVPRPRSQTVKSNPPSKLAAQKGNLESNDVTDDEGAPDAKEVP